MRIKGVADFGRRSECARLDGLLADVRAGRSAALLMWGEAGAGKTALLDYAAESAADLRVLRAAGVESEMELAFAALHQMCGPVLDRLDRLPDPQRAALETAFGLRAGPPPDRFLIGLAVLSLLGEARPKSSTWPWPRRCSSPTTQRERRKHQVHGPTGSPP
jgi:hypothetical protein